MTRIENTWQKYWDRHYPRGHEYGTCFANHDIKKFYINIPKNATNWGKLWALRSEFKESNYHQNQLLEQGYQPIVFLREPIDRWYAGMAEWIDRYRVFQPNNIEFTDQLLSLILERVAFDAHTEEQVMFLENINTNNCVFFRVDDQLINNFTHYVEHELGLNPETVPTNKQYEAKGGFKEDFKKQLKEAISSSFYQDFRKGQLSAEQRLKDYYKVDIDLYNSVQYYIKDNK